MHNRMPSRQRQGPAKAAPARRGAAVPVQGETQERTPGLPHERDEPADSRAASEPSARGVAQATREDIERGVVDADEGPVLDQAYDKVREGTADPEKKLSP